MLTYYYPSLNLSVAINYFQGTVNTVIIFVFNRTFWTSLLASQKTAKEFEPWVLGRRYKVALVLFWRNLIGGKCSGKTATWSCCFSEFDWRHIDVNGDIRFVSQGVKQIDFSTQSQNIHVQVKLFPKQIPLSFESK